MMKIGAIGATLVALFLISPATALFIDLDNEVVIDDTVDLRAANLAWITKVITEATGEPVELDQEGAGYDIEFNPIRMTGTEFFSSILDSFPVEPDLASVRADVETAGATGTAPAFGDAVFALESGVDGCAVDIVYDPGTTVTEILSSVSANGAGIVTSFDLGTGVGTEAAAYAGTISLTGLGGAGGCLDFFGLGIASWAVTPGVAVWADAPIVIAGLTNGGGPGVPAVPVDPNDPEGSAAAIVGVAEAVASCATSEPSSGYGAIADQLTADVYCFIHTGTTLAFSVDSATPAGAADYAACLSTTPNGIGVFACADDTFSCTHAPPSGWACPSGSVAADPGIYYLIVDRWDWFSEAGSTGEYVASMASDGAVSHFALAVDDGPEYYA